MTNVTIFASLAHSATNRKNHPVTLQDSLGHGIGDVAHGHPCLVVSVQVLVMTTRVWCRPGVQQLRLVTNTDGPVIEGGLAGEIVDADPGEDDDARGHAELLTGVGGVRSRVQRQ